MGVYHCLSFLVLAIGTFQVGSCERAESELLKQLFNGYSTSARPVDHLNETIDVKIRLSLFQIRALDLRNQEITLNIWVRMRWWDSYLTWDPADYDGLKQVRLPITDLWKPDVLLYNSVDSERTAVETFAETNAEVHHDGRVDWATVSLAMSSCKVNIRRYPYDSQVCPLQFGSWSYDDKQINLTAWNDDADLTNFIPNGEWDVMAMPARRYETKYSCCPDEVYPSVTYYLQLQRKPLFYNFNLVLPCVWLVIIAVLVFYLPPCSGEKVSLAITVLLAMVVFLLLIAENMPPTSEGIPILGKFFGATVILLSISTVVSVITTNISFSGDQGRRAPKLLRDFVFKCIARVVCLRDIARPFDDEESDTCELNEILPRGDATDTAVPGEMSVSLLREIRDKVDELKSTIKNRYSDNDRADRIKNEWIVLSVVLDRFFLMIYAITAVIMILAILIPVGEEDQYFQQPVSSY